MHAVIEHIDRHLDETLDLTSLAGVAHFSAYHFHRLFHVWTGEVLGDYVRRRRLETAALRLRAQNRVPVLQIALGVGFGSAEAFARAFRTRFACSPTQWRERKFDQAARKLDQAQRRAWRNNGGSKPKETVMSATARKLKSMNVTLIDREPVHVAYLRYTGPYGKPVSRFWQETVAAWMATNQLLGRVRYGVSLDDPSITHRNQCRYDACVETAPGELLSGGAHQKTIPGGKYAALAFEGKVEEIVPAWDALLRDWLPSSGLQLDSRPLFEHYPLDARFDPKTGRFSCDICVPVAPLGQG